MKITTTFVLGAALSAAITATASASTILANWTFEVSVPVNAGPHAAEAGLFAATSFASGFHVDAATTYSNPAGNGSLESFSSDRWSQGDYYQFTTSTVGYQNITFGWDQTRSSTGPATWDILWSTDGTSWNILLNDYTVSAITWSTGSTNLASVFGPLAAPAALDNQAIVYFRIMADSAAGGTAGTSRVDNVIISGTEIPAPGALALLGLAGVVGARRRRSA